MTWIRMQSSRVRRQVPASALRVPRVCFYGAFHTLSPRRGSSGPLCTQLPSPHRSLPTWVHGAPARTNVSPLQGMQQCTARSPCTTRTDLSLGGGEGLRRPCAWVKPGQGLALGEH